MFESPECKLYVVYEKDRGCGITMIAAFRSMERAQSVAKESGNFYIITVDLFN